MGLVRDEATLGDVLCAIVRFWVKLYEFVIRIDMEFQYNQSLSV